MSLKQKPKVDKDAERARKDEKRAQATEAERLRTKQEREDGMRKRRGASQGAFMRTSERGILAQVLGG
jgi:hypothetical protein